MEGELVAGGKTYISSRRLGKEVGYTNDYLSKLCRDGKIEGKLIGRSWFVLPESFHTFQQDIKQKRNKKNKEVTKEETIIDTKQETPPEIKNDKNTSQENTTSDTSDIADINIENKDKNDAVRKEEVTIEKLLPLNNLKYENINYPNKEDVEEDIATTNLEGGVTTDKKKIHSMIPMEILTASLVGVIIFIAGIVMERSFVIEAPSKNYPSGVYNSRIEMREAPWSGPIEAFRYLRLLAKKYFP